MSEYFIVEKVNASVSFHKHIPKTLKWLPYILICHCTSLSQWLMIDKNNCISVYHHILTPRGYQVCLLSMPCGLIGMCWVKCKQSNSHTSLITLCSQFLLSYGNQAIMVMWFAWIIWGKFYSCSGFELHGRLIYITMWLWDDMSKYLALFLKVHMFDNKVPTCLKIYQHLEYEWNRGWK